MIGLNILLSMLFNLETNWVVGIMVTYSIDSREAVLVDFVCGASLGCCLCGEGSYDV